MAFKERLKATLVGILIAAVILAALGIANAVLEGTHSIDTEGFTPVVEHGGELSLDGIRIVDNRTLGLYRIDADESMVVRVDDTATVGLKTLVIAYGGKEYTVEFEVKYRVDFVADGVSVDTQLVGGIAELVLPSAPSADTGYYFSYWDIDTTAELTASTTVNAVYREIDYPAIDGLTATYGDTLGTVELPSNDYGYWEFIDPADTPVGNAGVREHAVRFVYYSDPTVNKYDYATVTVAKKQYELSDVVDVFYYDGEVKTPYVPGVETVYAGGSNVLPGVYQYSLEMIDDNYTCIVEGTYEILKPTVTVTVSSATIAYPAAVPEFTFEVEGFENVDLLGITVAAPAFATQIGEYTVGINYTNENVNYIIHNGTLTVVKGDLSVETPELGDVTFEDKLADVEFLGRYLGTWSWESPETVIDSMDGITAYAIFTHDDPNLNQVRMAIEITDVKKKALTIELVESTFVYDPSKEHALIYRIVGGGSPEICETLTVIGNTPEKGAGTYSRTLTISDSRYVGSLVTELVIEKARPVTDFSAVIDTVWQENLRLESLPLPDGYSWQTPSYRITEAGDAAYTATFTPEDTANYLTVTGEITVRVSKAPVTVAGVLDFYTKTYDAQRLDIRNSGIAAYYTDGELSVKYYKDGIEVDEIVGAGEYLLTVTVTEGRNYLGTTIERTVVVERAENTDTVITQQSAVYLDPTSVLILPEGTEGSWSWLESELGAVGTKTVTAVFTPDASGNYLPREVEVTVTVTKRVLTAPSVPATLDYNGRVQNLGLISNGIYSVTDLGGRDVGSYTATLTLTDSESYQWVNGSDTVTISYSIVAVDNEFTYLPTDGVSIPYLAPLSSLSATAKLGAVKAEYKAVGAPDSDFSETLPTEVGSYVVRFTTTDTNCTAILTELRTFTITPIEVIPSPSILDTTLVYNGEKQSATLLDTVDGIYTVTDSGATLAGETGTVTLTIYNKNYVWADGSTVLTLTYEIVKAENSWLTEPTVSDTVIYGDEPTVSGTPAMDEMLIYHRPVGDNGDFVLGLPTDAGEYEIMFTTASVNAEAAEKRYSTLTVLPREILPPTATSPVYNGSAQTAVGTPTVGDPLYGVYTVIDGSATGAGDYVATATIINSNYKWKGSDGASVEIPYTVAKAQGEIILAKPSYEFTYSSENFLSVILGGAESANAEQDELTLEITSFFTHSDRPVQVDGIVRAGKYTVTVYLAESANYLGASATVTVTVAKLSVDVPTVTDKIYTGSELSVGLTDTEHYTVAGDLTATEVGEYTVTLTLTDPDNHEWLGSEGDVTVSRGYRISTAMNSWVKEPASISTVYSGNPVLVLGEALHGTVTVVYTIGGEVVDAPVAAGVYNVTVTAVADNYSDLVAYVTVTITKASVTAPTLGELVYNGTAQSPAVSGSGLGTLYTVTSETKAKNAGESASVALTLTDPANYKWDGISDATLTLTATVKKADVILSGAPVVENWVFGDAEQLPSASVIPSQTGFEGLTVEIFYLIDGTPVTYDALPKTDGRLNAGTYTVMAKVSDSSNWNGAESALATFTVERCTVTLPTPDSSLVFDGTSHTSGLTDTALYTVSDLGGTDAGSYNAYLTLTDTVNYKWQSTDSATATVSYEIAKFVFSDASVDNSGHSAEYGEAIDLTADTAYADLLDGYISYLYSTDGGVWYESIEALAESLGVTRLDTGSYLVKTVIADGASWVGHERIDGFTVTAKVLTPPTPAPLTYNGTEQTAISSGEGYTVSGGTATGAGGYVATLTLTDTLNYKWSTTDGASLEVAYSVAKAKNSWSTAPAISSPSVTYKDGYTVSGAPLYDTLRYKYKVIGESEYTVISSVSELPTAAGSYEIVFFTEGVNAEPLTATLYITINRKTVAKPTALLTPIYDGSVKTHGVTLTEGMVVRSSLDALNAGETVSVTLGLSDSNYVWSDGTSADYTLTSTVQRASVSFDSLTVPALTYTELPSPTVNVDKAFAESLVEFVYSSDRVNYYTLSELTVGGYLPAGEYWVKATASGANVAYSESAALSFRVSPATPDSISVSFGNSPMADGLYYQNQLTLDKNATTVSYKGITVAVSAYTMKVKGGFNGESTVFNVSVIPTDSDNFTAVDFEVTVPLKTVATVGYGGTPYGTIEDALTNATSNSEVWVLPDLSGHLVIAENATIRSDVTLILPYGTGSSDYNSNNKTEIATNQTQARDDDSLCMSKVYIAEGVTLTVNGTLIVSGELSSGNVYMAYVGHTCGKHARLILEDGAQIVAAGTSSKSAVVKTFGFVIDGAGSGTLVMDKYSKLYQPFIIRDHRNGGYLSSIYAVKDQYDLSPFTRFEFANVESLIVYKYGSELVGMVNINTSLGIQQAEGNVIGSTLTGSNGVLILTNEAHSYIRAKYDRATDVMNIDVYGGAKTSYLDISVLGMNMTTEDGVFPISYHLNISLHRAEGQEGDASFEMPQFFKLLPGSVLTVNEGTVLTVYKLSIYAQFEETAYRIVDGVYHTTQKYPTDKAPARLNVYGTLIADYLGGNVYTNGDGAKVIVRVATTVVSHEVAEYIDSSWTSKLGYCNVVTTELKLYYGDTLSINQVILNVEYTSSAAESAWLYDFPEIVELKLTDGYGILTNFAVIFNENGEIISVGTYDSRETKVNGTIYVLKGADVTFYLTNNQLFSEKAASSVTVSAIGDMHTKSSYEVTWKASENTPVIYNVKAITVTGSGVTKLTSVSFVYNTSTGNVSVTFKSASSGLSSGKKFTVNGSSASSSGLIIKSYTYSTTVSSDTTLDVV